jgi:hypothetical protein
VSADVIDIASRDAVDGAWAAFQAHAARSFDNRKLLLDRGYMEKWALLEARFKRLSLMPRSY